MNHTITSRRVTIPVEGHGETSGVLTRPDGSFRKTAVIVAHGAGNDMDTPLLVAFSEGLAHAGFPVMRFNFLYAEQGRKAPDRQEALMKTWSAAHAFFNQALGSRALPIVAAGKSMGGRIASMMAAEGLLSLKGLIFLGYPLHPMDNKEKVRDEHLYKITIPMLFFAGTKDPLCDFRKLDAVLKRLKAAWTLSKLEGGDHSLHVPKSTGLMEEDIYERIIEESTDWLSKLHK